MNQDEEEKTDLFRETPIRYLGFKLLVFKIY